MTSQAQGSKARLYAKDGSGVADWTSGTIKSYPFYRESMRKVASVVHPQVITGNRSEYGERARSGPNLYYGQIVFGVSPSEMAFWAPYYMGGTPSGTTYPLGTTLSPFSLYIDKVTTQYAFYDCYVDKALVVGKQNGPGGPPNYLTLALTIYALSYTNSPATSPTATIPSISGDYVPFVFEDTSSNIQIQSSNRETKQFAILHNNFLKQRYVNSLEPSISYPLHRQVKLQTRHPFDAGTSALDDVALSSSTTGYVKAVNGTVSVKWNFIGTLQLESQSPVVPGKVEIDLIQQFSARASGSNLEYQLEIDNTV
jgi:hypothetical protein